jgi:hypothetical protein
MLTAAQKSALLWLRNRNGDGMFDRPHGGVVLASGDYAPVMRSTWNALSTIGLVEFYASNRRIRVTTAGKALNLRDVEESA